MTSENTLKAGPLAGQDLSLLKAGTSVLVLDGCAVGVVASMDGRAVSVTLPFGYITSLLAVERLTHIGERDADGWIVAPEGGWAENPVPGCGGYVRFYDGGGGEIHDHTRWPDVVAFRLVTPEAAHGSRPAQEPSVPTVQAEGAGVGWRPIETAPDRPCMAVVAIITPETADRAAMGRGRDERFELAWWDGREWLESGTAHAFAERMYGGDGKGWMPTHWQRIVAPNATSTAEEVDDRWAEMERLAEEARLSEGLKSHRTAMRHFRAYANPAAVLELIDAARAGSVGISRQGNETQPSPQPDDNPRETLGTEGG